MSFRTVVINKHCKLDFRMNYMEIRQPEGKKRIFLDEIEVLIVENPAISLTGCLLSELMKRKVKVIFCDGKHNPQGEVVSYYGGYDSARKLRRQINWSDETKGAVWTAIVTEKIRQQAQFLHELEHEREAGLLDGYVAGMAELENYLNDLSMELDVEMAYDKLSLNNLLKSVGMRVIIDYKKLVERLFAYMDLVRRFEGEKLFLMVNLRGFVSLEDMELFMQTVVAHGLRVLLVDNQAYPLLPLEKRRIIDSDLCEI